MTTEFETTTTKAIKQIDKTYKTLLVKNVKMFFPRLDKPEFNELKGVDQYRALFVLGGSESDAFKQVYTAIKEITASSFLVDGKPAATTDLPEKNKIIRKQLPLTAEEKKKDKKESSYVNEFYIQLARPAKKGAPQIIDAKKNVLTVDQIALLGNGTIVNVLMSYGSFLFKGTAGVCGVLEAIQVVKANSYNHVDANSMFDELESEADTDTSKAFTQVEEAPF